jgi:hypothetical protein
MSQSITTKLVIRRINTWTIAQLPKDASAKLPSRGMVLIEGEFNNQPLQVALEPDGVGSHWFQLNSEQQKWVKPHNTLTLKSIPPKDWPDPKAPSDVSKAFQADNPAKAVWDDITPMARWDWIRWVNGTKQTETRKRRIEVMRDKLKKGIRRACCFNRTECTEQAVSLGGILITP